MITFESLNSWQKLNLFHAFLKRDILLDLSNFMSIQLQGDIPFVGYSILSPEKIALDYNKLNQEGVDIAVAALQAFGIKCEKFSGVEQLTDEDKKILLLLSIQYGLIRDLQDFEKNCMFVVALGREIEKSCVDFYRQNQEMMRPLIARVFQAAEEKKTQLATIKAQYEQKFKEALKVMPQEIKCSYFYEDRNDGGDCINVVTESAQRAMDTIINNRGFIGLDTRSPYYTKLKPFKKEYTTEVEKAEKELKEVRQNAIVKIVQEILKCNQVYWNSLDDDKKDFYINYFAKFFNIDSKLLKSCLKNYSEFLPFAQWEYDPDHSKNLQLSNIFLQNNGTFTDLNAEHVRQRFQECGIFPKEELLSVEMEALNLQTSNQV